MGLSSNIMLLDTSFCMQVYVPNCGYDNDNNMISVYICFSLARPDSIFMQGTYTACHNTPLHELSNTKANS